MSPRIHPTRSALHLASRVLLGSLLLTAAPAPRALAAAPSGGITVERRLWADSDVAGARFRAWTDPDGQVHVRGRAPDEDGARALRRAAASAGASADVHVDPRLPRWRPALDGDDPLAAAAELLAADPVTRPHVAVLDRARLEGAALRLRAEEWPSDPAVTRRIARLLRTVPGIGAVRIGGVQAGRETAGSGRSTDRPPTPLAALPSRPASDGPGVIARAVPPSKPSATLGAGPAAGDLPAGNPPAGALPETESPAAAGPRRGRTSDDGARPNPPRRTLRPILPAPDPEAAFPSDGPDAKPVPPEAVPSKTVPSKTVPPKTVPPKTVPPKTVPPKILPPKTLPPTTVPSKAVPPRAASGAGQPGATPSEIELVLEDLLARAVARAAGDGSSLEVEVRDGVARVRGTVVDRAAARRVRKAALASDGVRELRGRLRLKDGSVIPLGSAASEDATEASDGTPAVTPAP